MSSRRCHYDVIMMSFCLSFLSVCLAFRLPHCSVLMARTRMPAAKRCASRVSQDVSVWVETSRNHAWQGRSASVLRISVSLALLGRTAWKARTLVRHARVATPVTIRRRNQCAARRATPPDRTQPIAPYVILVSHFLK